VVAVKDSLVGALGRAFPLGLLVQAGPGFALLRSLCGRRRSTGNSSTGNKAVLT
jgi:hypothetical protein